VASSVVTLMIFPSSPPLVGEPNAILPEIVFWAIEKL